MEKKSSRNFLFLLTCFLVFAGPLKAVDYNDVLVVVNTNSTVSVNVANYFQTKRSIPEKNMVRIAMPATEEIDGTQFATISKQIADSMIARKIDTTINYIVTTKDVPLRICRNPPCNYVPPSQQYATSASFDSEMMLIIYKTGLIGSTSAQISGYYNTNKHFSSKAEQMFLVTRLTGYNQQLIYNLIDNGGPDIIVGKNNTRFVLDGVATGTYASTNPNVNLPATQTMLQNRGWTVTLDMTNGTYLKGQSVVLGCWSWGSNHQSQTQSSSRPNNFWSKGSISAMGVSLTGRTFDSTSAYFGVGQSLAADWLAEGAAGAISYVYECYVSSYVDPLVLFDRYTDTTKTYNLAESYYMSLYTTSWMGVVLGDPKTSLKPVMVGVDEITKAENLHLELFPNPATNSTTLSFVSDKEQRMKIVLYDLAGKKIETIADKDFPGGYTKIDISTAKLANGVYQLSLEGEGFSTFKKLVVLK